MWNNKKILLVAAHPDDLEFGMGATMNQLDKDDVKVVVFSDTVNLNGDGIIKELDNSMGVYGFKYNLHGIENMNFARNENVIRQQLYDIKQSFKPDVIFSTSTKSYNIDHRVLGESVLSVFQEQTILFYEVTRGDYEFKPNFYNGVSEDDIAAKQLALEQYHTQKKRYYIKSDITRSQMIYRGGQVSKEFAEAFEVGRIII